jgi:Ribbon-helix-helix protein, copG family
MAKRSAEDYAGMSAAVESGAYTASGLEMGPSLQMGRPVGGQHRGSSPTRTVRMSVELDLRLEAYAEAVHMSPSEVMRRAVDEYLNRHPTGA